MIFSRKMLEEGSMPNVAVLNVSNSFQPLMQRKSAKNQIMSTKMRRDSLKKNILCMGFIGLAEVEIIPL